MGTGATRGRPCRLTPDSGAAPGWEPRTGPDTNPYDKVRRQDTTVLLEALRFLDGARLWIDHAAAGDIGIAEAAAGRATAPRSRRVDGPGHVMAARYDHDGSIDALADGAGLSYDEAWAIDQKTRTDEIIAAADGGTRQVARRRVLEP